MTTNNNYLSHIELERFIKKPNDYNLGLTYNSNSVMSDEYRDTVDEINKLFGDMSSGNENYDNSKLQLFFNKVISLFNKSADVLGKMKDTTIIIYRNLRDAKDVIDSKIISITKLSSAEMFNLEDSSIASELSEFYFNENKILLNLILYPEILKSFDNNLKKLLSSPSEVLKICDSIFKDLENTIIKNGSSDKMFDKERIEGLDNEFNKLNKGIASIINKGAFYPKHKYSDIGDLNKSINTLLDGRTRAAYNNKFIGILNDGGNVIEYVSSYIKQYEDILSKYESGIRKLAARVGNLRDPTKLSLLLNKFKSIIMVTLVNNLSEIINISVMMINTLQYTIDTHMNILNKLASYKVIKK